jgi:hypothetical protein
VHLFLDAVAEVFEIELTCGITAVGLDFRRRVRISRVEVVASNRGADISEVANELPVALDVFVAPWLAELL